MSATDFTAIRESIALGREQEAASGDLAAHLSAVASRLHHAIGLPAERPIEALLQFVIRYVEEVPESLTALSRLLREADIYEQGQTFIAIARDFFFKPPELVQAHTGLHALIDQAYLAHRLLEEINDRLLMLGGAPLTPMNMTMANIVVHDILGDEFANQLDLAVHYAIESLFHPQDLAANRRLTDFLHDQKAAHWRDHLQRWPCLAEDSAIAINLGSAHAARMPVH